MSRVSKYINTETKLMVTRDWRNERMCMTVEGYGDSFRDDEKFLELEGGDDCKTL